MAKKQDLAWLDEQEDFNSWDDLVDAVRVQYKINAALHGLLYKHQVSVKDIANVCYQARSDYYGWKKTTKFKPNIVKKTEVKEKQKKVMPGKKKQKK